MADNKDDMSDVIVTFEDDDGHSYNYAEEMIMPVDGVNYAILVRIHDEDDNGQGAGDGDDEDAIIAKIITNAEGEEEYVAPTEEEFAAAEKAYNALVDENESM